MLLLIINELIIFISNNDLIESKSNLLLTSNISKSYNSLSILYDVLILNNSIKFI